MNALNVRYDVYGGVPADLVRSSITISRQFGTRPRVFRTARPLYRILLYVGQFQIGDCRLIRFFKMLNKLEILSKVVGGGAETSRRLFRTRISVPQTISRGGRRSDSDWSIKWCGPPRPSKTSRSSLCRERAQATFLQRSASDPETPSLARRAGSESNSAGAGALPCAGRAHPARLGLNGRQRITLGPTPTHSAPALPRFAIWKSRRGTAGRQGEALAQPRLERCDGCGSRRFATPPADGRSAIRGAEISPIAGSRRSEANPIAPAIAKWRIGRRRRGRARASDKGSAPSGVHGGCREASRVRPKVAANCCRAR